MKLTFEFDPDDPDQLITWIESLAYIDKTLETLPWPDPYWYTIDRIGYTTQFCRN